MNEPPLISSAHKRISYSVLTTAHPLPIGCYLGRAEQSVTLCDSSRGGSAHVHALSLLQGHLLIWPHLSLLSIQLSFYFLTLAAAAPAHFLPSPIDAPSVDGRRALYSVAHVSVRMLPNGGECRHNSNCFPCVKCFCDSCVCLGGLTQTCCDISSMPVADKGQGFAVGSLTS